MNWNLCKYFCGILPTQICLFKQIGCFLRFEYMNIDFVLGYFHTDDEERQQSIFFIELWMFIVSNVFPDTQTSVLISGSTEICVYQNSTIVITARLWFRQGPWNLIFHEMGRAKIGCEEAFNYCSSFRLERNKVRSKTSETKDINFMNKKYLPIMAISTRLTTRRKLN